MSRLYYYYGKDIWSVSKAVNKLLKSFGNEEIRFQGAKDLDITAISNAVMQFSMFSEYNVIYINDLNAEDLNADKFDGLMGVLSDIPSSAKIIFAATGVDIFSDRKVKNEFVLTAKNKKLIDFIKQNGEVKEFKVKTRADLIKMLGTYGISPEPANLLCEYCLDDTLSIITEAEKLTSYTENVTVQTVHEMVSKRIDTNAFALAKAVAVFDGKTAFRLLDELFSIQAEPIPIWAAISSSFLDLYRAKVALQSGKNQQNIEQDFNYKGKGFIVANAIRSVQRISLQKLRYCLKTITETDMLLKSSRVDKRILMEKALAQMLVSR